MIFVIFIFVIFLEILIHFRPVSFRILNGITILIFKFSFRFSQNSVSNFRLLDFVLDDVTLI